MYNSRPRKVNLLCYHHPQLCYVGDDDDENEAVQEGCFQLFSSVLNPILRVDQRDYKMESGKNDAVMGEEDEFNEDAMLPLVGETDEDYNGEEEDDVWLMHDDLDDEDNSDNISKTTATVTEASSTPTNQAVDELDMIAAVSITNPTLAMTLKTVPRIFALISCLPFESAPLISR